jgi:hypothetical protein
MATVPADLAKHHWHPPTHQHPPPGCQRPGQQRSRSRRAVLAACFHTGMPAFARMVHARGLLARLSDASGIQAPVRTAWFRRHNMSQRTAPPPPPSWSMFLGQQQQMRWPATPRLLRAAVAHKVQVHSAELMAFATTLLWVYPVQRQPAQTFRSHCRRQLCQLCWAEAPIKIARMTLTIKLDRNWSSFQLANSAPPLSVTDSAIAPSARMLPHLRAARW